MRLVDRYYREFKYLRLSITENCNFRYQYCLPNGYSALKKQGANFLRLAEIKNVITVFADLGVEKVRLTGENRLYVVILLMYYNLFGMMRVLKRLD